MKESDNETCTNCGSPFIIVDTKQVYCFICGKPTCYACDVLPALNNYIFNGRCCPDHETTVIKEKLEK